jgi:O-antigen ligase
MTIASAVTGIDDFRRDVLPRVADALAVGVAVSLPWSTSATGILIVLWLLATLPTLSVEAVRREILSAPGGLPVLFAIWAAAGMAWADVPIGERFHGLESFLRLIMIPVLFAQFRRSDRGLWVGAAFLASAAVLLACSYVMINLPNAMSLGNGYGVPVKDDIAQSGIFTLSAFALFHLALTQWNAQRRGVAAACLMLGVLFIANMIYVVTSRTALVVIPALYVLLAFHCGLHRRSLMAIAVYVLFGVVAIGAVWASSHNLRYRVTVISQEVGEHATTGADTSSGARLDFWRYSLRIVSEAPVIGHGTGTIADQFRRHADGPADMTATNPHSQVFTVAIQLGAVGVIVLLAMWAAHWLMFTVPGLPAWIGLVVVTQGIISCQFNSHLLDFTQSWLYVFGVGVFGGTVLGRKEGRTSGEAPVPAASPGP